MAMHSARWPAVSAGAPVLLLQVNGTASDCSQLDQQRRSQLPCKLAHTLYSS